MFMGVLAFLANANYFGRLLHWPTLHAVKRNGNLIVHEKLTKLPPKTLKCTFKKEFVRKKIKI